MDMSPTGILYKGRGIRLTASVEPLESLKELAQYIKGEVLKDFKKKYGNILDLLNVPVQVNALTVLGQYWDDSLRCFTFQDFQIAPTIEEYGELLRVPLVKGEHVYKYPGHLPSKDTIARLLEVDEDKVRIVCAGKVEGISRAYVESHLKTLAEKKKWSTFNRVFAMAIYGVILFPFSFGVIDLYAISVFKMVEHHRVNPIPAILAETYMTLSHCHANRRGKMKCCLHLLNVWIMNHLYGKKFQQDKRHDSYNPLTSFKDQEGQTRLDHKGWIEVFSQLRAENIFWKLSCLRGEEIICHCGDLLNVPLLGARGGINYNPTLLLRQFAFPQVVPTKEAVQIIHFVYDDSTDNLRQHVGNAWDRVVYKGKLELEKHLVWATEEYQVWLTERIRRTNPAFAPPDPLHSNNAIEGDELSKQFERKEEELEELMKADRENKQVLRRLQEEYVSLRGEVEKMKKRNACEENSEVKRLRRENMELRHAINDLYKHIVSR